MATLEVALANACPILALQPREIWIESESGSRVGTEEIVRRCRDWGALPMDTEAELAKAIFRM